VALPGAERPLPVTPTQEQAQALPHSVVA